MQSKDASFLTLILPRLVGIFYASAVTLEFISLLMDILSTQMLKSAQAAVLGGGVGRIGNPTYI